MSLNLLKVFKRLVDGHSGLVADFIESNRAVIFRATYVIDNKQMRALNPPENQVILVFGCRS
jgi:hypothetical protein